nr:immunoglobulin heavy chain junction region [Mus musculus]MBK4197239.1 immunoglobulin heavy chain junction region [Mus musculus]
CEGLRRFAYW